VEQARSFQDIVRQRQGAGFVGRAGELALFERNLVLSPDDEAKRFVFNVHGDGGVGKTHLVRRWAQLAGSAGARCAYTDEHVVGVPDTMARISAQLGASGGALRDFDKRYETYVRHRDQVAHDPQAPREAWSRLTRTAVKVGLHASKALPFAGPVVALVDADAAADATDQFRRYLGGKFGDNKAVRLLLDPVAELAPEFVRGLGEVAAERPVALFFDTYEETGRYLDGWLLHLLRGSFGELPASIVLTIAGRHPLDPDGWSDFAGVVAPVPLRPFTGTEARQFLAGRGIVAEPITDLILTLSGRLPLLVATLAENRPDDPDDSDGPVELDDPSGTAVRRFLKWEHDEERRTAAKLGALPRTIDADLLAAACGSESAGELFGWLREMPFVSFRAGRYRYHEVVRDAMIRLRRAESPQGLREVHRRLADTYRGWAADLPTREWSDATWRGHRLEQLYHALCAAPAALAEPLADAVLAAGEGRFVARRFAEVLRDAGRDGAADALRELGERLLASLSDEGGDTAPFLTLLLREPALPPDTAVDALVDRGWDHFMADRDDEAEADADEALRRDAGHARAHALRGAILSWHGRAEEALAELTRAIELRPDSRSAWSYRGMAHRKLGRYDEAVADLDRAIELDPGNAWSFGQRATARMMSNRFAEAVADLTRALDLDRARRAATAETVTDTWYLASRGYAYRRLGRFSEALADLSAAIEQDPTDVNSLGERGAVLFAQDRYEEALADLERAIELDPTDAAARGWLGLTYAATGRREDALAQHVRAVELEPESVWLRTQLSLTLRTLGRREDALAEASRALEHLDRENDIVDKATALGVRGETLWLLGRHEEALADLDRGVELDPDAWLLGTRGQVLRALGRHEEALADVDRVLAAGDPDEEARAREVRAEALRSLGRDGEAVDERTRLLAGDPDSTWSLGRRALSLRRLERYDEALADLDRMIELDPADPYPLAQRGETLRLVDRFDEALAELDRALALEPDNAWTIGTRAQVLAELGRYEESVAELGRALARAAADAEDWLRSARGTVLRVLGRYDAAIADLTRAIELDPDDGWAYGQRAWAYRGAGREELVEADLAAAERLDPEWGWRAGPPSPGPGVSG
jgi:tetratricopeptide (TPR) repeat protein